MCSADWMPYCPLVLWWEKVMNVKGLARHWQWPLQVFLSYLIVAVLYQCGSVSLSSSICLNQQLFPKITLLELYKSIMHCWAQLQIVLPQDLVFMAMWWSACVEVLLLLPQVAQEAFNAFAIKCCHRCCHCSVLVLCCSFKNRRFKMSQYSNGNHGKHFLLWFRLTVLLGGPDLVKFFQDYLKFESYFCIQTQGPYWELLQYLVDLSMAFCGFLHPLLFHSCFSRGFGVVGRFALD